MTQHDRHQERGLCSRLIGVIDLRGGLAVRGVGGRRQEYRATDFFCDQIGNRTPVNGDSLRLIDCYRQVGIGSLYVADLDGIVDGRWQRREVEAIMQSWDPAGRLLIDLGFRGRHTPAEWDWARSLVQDRVNAMLVVASECATNPEMIEELVRHVPREQVAVGLDYQDSRWISETATERQWFTACREQRIGTVLGLDLAAIGGTSVEPTLSLCRRIRAQLPSVHYITGGGIRNQADASRLIRAGADELLVASWFSGDTMRPVGLSPVDRRLGESGTHRS